MASQNPTSDRVWPETGLWAASFRVMFPLAALWAAVCVALWQWGRGVWPNLDLSLGWHVHEMTFGFGGAALAGYLLTACSSWTGRAPVGGWRLAGIAALWVSARVLVFTATPWAAWVSLAMFWSVAACLLWEARRGGRQWRMSFVAITLMAGIVSATFLTRDIPLAAPVIGFAALLIFVGGRMVPAFLFNAVGGKNSDVSWGSAVLALGVLASGVAPGVVAVAIGAVVFAQALWWPLHAAFRDGLLAMLVAAYLWLPLGLIMMGGADLFAPMFEARALHALGLGAMGGLIMAVSARGFARRESGVLKARPGMLVAFFLIMLGGILRILGWLDGAAAAWFVGWLVYLGVMVPQLRGPVPRPVFSGARGS